MGTSHPRCRDFNERVTHGGSGYKNKTEKTQFIIVNMR